MGMYLPFHQTEMWDESLKSTDDPVAHTSLIVEVNTKLDNQSEDTSHGTLGTPNQFDQEASKPFNKIQRRLAQNREAARKSRLRKKAYVQQLETSRLKLMQLEQELHRARQQDVYTGGGGAESSHLGFSGSINTGIATFEMEYGHWVEEQNRHISKLRTALQAHGSDAELRILVETGMNNYFELFRMKAGAARSDVFYVMSGLWKTSSERCFLWIGGFRPSELLKAEDALSQGMDKLQETLSMTIAEGQLGDGNYTSQVGMALKKLEALISFVNQADHIRQETLNQMARILTMRQTARGLLALGEYFQRLRALSTIWSTRPHEPT